MNIYGKYNQINVSIACYGCIILVVEFWEACTNHEKLSNACLFFLYFLRTSFVFYVSCLEFVFVFHCYRCEILILEERSVK